LKEEISRKTLRSEELLLTATDKLNDFVTIASRNARFLPLRPGQNFEISLDGHAPSVQPELAKQVHDGSLNARRS